MTTKQTAGAIIAALALGLAIGRFSLPAKLVTKVQTVEVEKQQIVAMQKQQDNSVVVVTETKKKDGSDVIVTTTQKNVVTVAKTDTKEQDSKQSVSTKEVMYNTQKLGINVLAGPQSFSNLTTIVYGGQLTYGILGPIDVGVYGFTDGRMGVSFGLRF